MSSDQKVYRPSVVVLALPIVMLLIPIYLAELKDPCEPNNVLDSDRGSQCIQALEEKDDYIVVHFHNKKAYETTSH